MIRKTTAVLVTLIACVVMLEIGLRAVGRNPSNMADGIAEQDGDSFKLKRNTKKFMMFPAFSYTVYTNEYGFRDGPEGSGNLKGKPFVTFLGASDVFGNGVDYEDSFPGVFAAAASAHGVEVLNLAVGGHYFLDQERLLREFIETTSLVPTQVLFCVNALHIPKFDRRNQNIIVKSGYVIDRDGWRIAYLRLLAGNWSSAFCFFRDGIRRIQERWLDFEVNEKSPEFIQVYSKHNPIREPGKIQEFHAYLSGFERFCDEHGMEVVYVYLPLSDSFKLVELLERVGEDPASYDTEFYEELMRSHCEKNNVKLVNLRPVLQERYDKGEGLRFKLDPHFNKAANKTIGDFLVKELLPPD
jgi:hypothetical protein